METESGFEQFLLKKGIDPGAFAKSEPERHARLKVEFGVAGAVAMDLAKKFLWNPLRQRYPMADSLQKE